MYHLSLIVTVKQRSLATAGFQRVTDWSVGLFNHMTPHRHHKYSVILLSQQNVIVVRDLVIILQSAWIFF